MYHSISEGPGPTCIAPETFRRQMAEIEEAGFAVVSVADLLGWLCDDRALPERCVALTFDDAFEDFATTAFPELCRRGWPATVFVPSGCVGGFNAWEGPHGSPRRRRLMHWATIEKLSALGVEFGGHGVSHSDLTRLPATALEAEVAGSKHAIEDRTGCAAAAFAAPFGHTTAAVERVVRRHYAMAVGTGLDRAGRDSNRFNLPRIEMWYFRRPERWRAFLHGRAEGFLRARQLLRRARRLAAALSPAGRAARDSLAHTKAIAGHGPRFPWSPL
jgi:peptidoglycan/xylan/chitin deacetylase (PgdA/CDA1 family)